VSFSLYSPVAVNLFVNDDKDLDFTYIEHEFQKGWNHISIFLRNNSIFYFLNNKEIKSMNAFHYHEIVVQENTTNIFWKIHNYQFMMSVKVTDGKPTTLKLPHVENSCFLLYLSLCENCVLTIPELNRIYNSTNDLSFF
jgi:hypothetical protein